MKRCSLCKSMTLWVQEMREMQAHLAVLGQMNVKNYDIHTEVRYGDLGRDSAPPDRLRLYTFWLSRFNFLLYFLLSFRSKRPLLGYTWTSFSPQLPPHQVHVVLSMFQSGLGGGFANPKRT